MSGPHARPALRDFWHDLPREGKLLLSVVAFQFIGTGLVLPFWVVYLHEVRDFSLSTTGLLLGLQPLAGLLAVGPGGAIIDRVGGRVVMLGSLVAIMAGQLVMAAASTPLLAGVALVLTGISFGVIWPASQTLIASVVPTQLRQRYFGVNFTLLNLGIGIGGIVGGSFVDVDRVITFQAIYVADAASSTLPLVLLLGPLRHIAARPEADPADGPVAAGSYREVLRQRAVPTLAVVTFVASFVGYSQLNIGMPAYAREIGEVSTRGLGFAFAANTAVIVLLQLVVLQRIEGRRRTRVIVAMAAAWGVCWLFLAGSGLLAGTLGATLLVAACASIFAMGETLLQPTIPALVNDLTTDRLRGRSNALNSACFQLPMVLAPPVTGFLIGHGLEAVYIGMLVAGCAVTALLSVTRLEPRLTDVANGVRRSHTIAEPPVPVPGAAVASPAVPGAPPGPESTVTD